MGDVDVGYADPAIVALLKGLEQPGGEFSPVMPVRGRVLLRVAWPRGMKGGARKGRREMAIKLLAYSTCCCGRRPAPLR